MEGGIQGASYIAVGTALLGDVGTWVQTLPLHVIVQVKDIRAVNLSRSIQQYFEGAWTLAGKHVSQYPCGN